MPAIKIKLRINIIFVGYIIQPIEKRCKYPAIHKWIKIKRG